MTGKKAPAHARDSSNTSRPEREESMDGRVIDGNPSGHRYGARAPVGKVMLAEAVLRLKSPRLSSAREYADMAFVEKPQSLWQKRESGSELTQRAA